MTHYYTTVHSQPYAEKPWSVVRVDDGKEDAIVDRCITESQADILASDLNAGVRSESDLVAS